jgi:hypothetical protein
MTFKDLKKMVATSKYDFHSLFVLETRIFIISDEDLVQRPRFVTSHTVLTEKANSDDMNAVDGESTVN